MENKNIQFIPEGYINFKIMLYVRFKIYICFN